MIGRLWRWCFGAPPAETGTVWRPGMKAVCLANAASWTHQLPSMPDLGGVYLVDDVHEHADGLWLVLRGFSFDRDWLWNARNFRPAVKDDEEASETMRQLREIAAGTRAPDRGVRRVKRKPAPARAGEG